MTTDRDRRPRGKLWHRTLPLGLVLLVAWLVGDLSLAGIAQTPAATSSPVASPESDIATPATTPATTLENLIATPRATNIGQSRQGIVPGGELRPGQGETSGRAGLDANSILGRAGGRRTLLDRTVYDPYRLLTSEQREAIENDANRLERSGVPILVYVRISEASDEQTREFADRLLDEWSVESSPGADDGMVVLVSMGVAERRSGELTIRTGANALPEHGLSTATVARIADDEMAPRLDRGQIYSALQTGLRSFLYLVFYFPEPAEPPSESERQLAGILSWLAPSLGSIALLSLIGSWFIQHTRRGLRRPWNRRWLIAAFGLAYCVVFAVLSVYAESRIGVAMVVLVALALVFTWLIGRGAGKVPPHSARRTIQVRPWLQRARLRSAPSTRVPATPSGRSARASASRRT